jgi:hypothetical protein
MICVAKSEWLVIGPGIWDVTTASNCLGAV